MFRSKIKGTGSYLPERILTNKDLEKLVDTSDEWITERTGIKTRHMASPEQATSDLCVNSAKRALESADLDPSDIDLIILATITPDQTMPSAACDLQVKLGAPSVMSFDLTAACSGFLYALNIADQFIKTGRHKNILVTGAETLSRIVDFEDRETCILFGDGAGSVILSRNDDDSDPAEIHGDFMRAEGKHGGLLTLTSGGSRKPLSQDVLDNRDHFVKMKGREIFKQAVRTMADCCREVLTDTKTPISDIAWMIPHQANFRILEAMGKQIDFPIEKVIVNLDHTGNTSAATIPIALDEAVRDGRVQPGQKLLLTAFGAGLTSGAILLTY